jgi:hypothetical protein
MNAYKQENKPKTNSTFAFFITVIKRTILHSIFMSSD